MIGGVELNPGPCSEDIIAALSAEAPSDEIRNCIRMFDPNKTTTEIKKALNKASADSLVATMTYLGVPGQEAYVKPAVINSLICRIENLLPDHCPVCSDTYVISKDEMSLLNCSICGQAAHTQCLLDLLEIPQDKRDTLGPDDITKRINPHSVPGIIYICLECQKSTVPSEEDGKKRKNKQKSDRTQSVSVGPDSTPAVQRHVDLAPVAESGAESSDEEEDEAQVASAAHGQRNHPPTDPRMPDQMTSAQQVTQPRSQEQRSADQSQKPICSFYRKGNCRYGISGKGCPRYHPPPCRKLVNHGTKGPRGCRDGRNCPKFHPRMCSTSLSVGQCFIRDCRLRHVRGTMRTQEQQVNPARNQSTSHHLW